jgi:hypothetical protein
VLTAATKEESVKPSQMPSATIPDSSLICLIFCCKHTVTKEDRWDYILPLQVFKNLLSDREARLRIIELSKNLSKIIKEI